MSEPVAPIQGAAPGFAGRLRALASFVAERMQWARQAGITFDGRRDLYQAFGYARTLSVADHRMRYERGGIAGTIVDAAPNATWRGGVVLEENPDQKIDTPFELAWKKLNDRVKVVPNLERGDILSRIGPFGVLVIGSAGSVNLEAELERGDGTGDTILYLQPYAGSGGTNANSARIANNAETVTMAQALVDDFDKDPASQRFGQPKAYRIKRVDFSGTVVDTALKPIHWSRIIHLAEKPLDNEVYAAPALERVWNLLDDLDKVTGGGAEAFFQRANQGRAWSVDKDVEFLDDGDKAAFREQIEKWEMGMSRNVIARGMDVKDLGSDVANFSPQATAILQQIAGTIRMPMRTLTGTESGQLASGQDRENWNDQVAGRREQYAGPFVVRRLVDRLVAYGHLPEPKQYEVKFGTSINLTEAERSAGATAWASVNRTQGTIVFPDDEIRKKWYGLDPLTDAQRKAANQAKADVAKATAPEPVAPVVPGKFPRAASEAFDDALVEQLADAIEAGDADGVLAVLEGL